MDLDKSLDIIRETVKELYSLREEPHIELKLETKEDESKWRLQISKRGADYSTSSNTANVLFDDRFEWPAEAIIAALDKLNSELDEKYAKIARHRDRMHYHSQDPDQKNITFGRRIDVDPEPHEE